MKEALNFFVRVLLFLALSLPCFFSVLCAPSQNRSEHDLVLKSQHVNNSNHSIQNLKFEELECSRQQLNRVTLQKRGYLPEEVKRIAKLVNEGRNILDDDFHSKYIFNGNLIVSGMNGIIYKATTLSGTEVVVKLIPNISAFQKKDLIYIIAPDRELWEAKIMRNASFYNIPIVKYVDSGRAGKMYYIVMELVKNSSGQVEFSKYIAEQPSGVLTLSTATKYLHQLATTFAQLHALNIYHGDIKTSNILINSQKKLIPCDFGAGRILSSPHEKVGKFLGTPLYAPPTLAHINGYNSEALKHDVYSLGMTFFFMLRSSEEVENSRVLDRNGVVFLLREYVLSFTWATETLTEDHKIMFRGLLNSDEEERWTMAELVNFLVNSPYLLYEANSDVIEAMNEHSDYAPQRPLKTQNQLLSPLGWLRKKVFGSRIL